MLVKPFRVMFFAFLWVFVINLSRSKSTATECRFKNTKVWLQHLSNSISSKRNAVTHLRRQYQQILQRIPKKEDRSFYLENFSNIFDLSRRLTKEWTVYVFMMKTTFGDEIKAIKYSPVLRLVSQSAVRALVRIQETYNFTAKSIADGELEGAYRTSLTAEDCFDVGAFYYRLKHPARAVEWLRLALTKSNNDTGVSPGKIMEYVHLSQCFIGDSKGSSETLTSLLQQFPSHEPSPQLEADYEKVGNSTCTEIAKEINKSLYKEFAYVHNVKPQLGLCSVQNHRHPSDRRLKCRLIDYHQPHLRIQPFKMEELNLDPPLLLFHRVLNDDEIEAFKRLFHNKTRPAILDYPTDIDQTHDTQYNFWIKDNNSWDKRFSSRAKSMTNMELHRCEPSMVASYGVGGEIKLHDDLGSNDDILKRKSRADYITVNFYMNNVTEGGLTIFPGLNQSVIPVKGNALMWFNRKPDLSPNLLMIHSGCPVIQGSKWIMTKWFHVVGQDYPKCSLKKKDSRKHYYLK